MDNFVKQLSPLPSAILWKRVEKREESGEEHLSGDAFRMPNPGEHRRLREMSPQRELEEEPGRHRTRERDRWFFKPQRTICKDHGGKSRSKKKRRSGNKPSKPSWWKTILLPFWKWTAGKKERGLPPKQTAQRWGPLYLTESYCGDRTRTPAYKRASGVWGHGQSLVVAEVGRSVEMPYFNLNSNNGYRPSSPAPAPATARAFPIYLVT